MEDAFKIPFWMLVVTGGFAVLVGLDLFTDYRHGSSGFHLLLEGLLLAASGAFFVLGIKQPVGCKKNRSGRSKPTWSLSGAKKNSGRRNRARYFRGSRRKSNSSFANGN